MWGGNGPAEEKLFLSYFKQRLLLKEQTKKHNPNTLLKKDQRSSSWVALLALSLFYLFNQLKESSLLKK